MRTLAVLEGGEGRLCRQRAASAAGADKSIVVTEIAPYLKRSREDEQQ